ISGGEPIGAREDSPGRFINPGAAGLDRHVKSLNFLITEPEGHARRFRSRLLAIGPGPQKILAVLRKIELDENIPFPAQASSAAFDGFARGRAFEVVSFEALDARLGAVFGDD